VPQQFNALDIVYADQRPAQFNQPRFDDRRPPQFPSASPATVPAQQQPSRANQFSLFSPEPKIDIYKPKVRISRVRKIKCKKNRRKRNFVLYLIKKKRRYYD
jgi:hypothetical protein